MLLPSRLVSKKQCSINNLLHRLRKATAFRLRMARSQRCASPATLRSPIPVFCWVLETQPEKISSGRACSLHYYSFPAPVQSDGARKEASSKDLAFCPELP